MTPKYFVLPALLFAGTATADGKPTERHLLEIIRANGCQITQEEADRLLPPHGFTKDQTRKIGRKWKKKGMLSTKVWGALALKEEACKG